MAWTLMPLARRLVQVTVALLLTAPNTTAVKADSFKTPPAKIGPAVSVQAYGHQNPDCLEWTNGCVLCVSDAGAARCSTPGIACTPAGLTCKRAKH